MAKNKEKYRILDKFNVSRETYYLLEYYQELILDKNKEINLISRKNNTNFYKRHILDCAQIYDFIDLNEKTCTDLGTGAGLPGIILAILLKGKNINYKMNLYEKSYRKSNFLKEVTEKLNLNVQIYQKDVFKEKNLISGSIVARAFKPLPIILELIEMNFKNYSNLVVFMGKNGKQLLEDSIKNWNFEYKVMRSVTSNDSFILNINNIKRK